MAIDKILGNGALDQVADSVFSAVSDSVSEIKAMQKRKAAENVQVVVQALKKIETDLRSEYGDVADKLAERIASIKDGQDGRNGADGRNGKDGRLGRDGLPGPKGNDGLPGRDGVDGVDGVSVTNAYIDFDGSLIINLSTGQSLNVGEVVAPDLAERIKVISTMSTNAAVVISDEGVAISPGVKNINFVGATVTATASGDDVTVNVSAGTGSVTSVSGTGTVSGISLSGTVTTSGNLTLGGALNLSSPPSIGNTAPNTGRFTDLTVDDNTILGASNSDTVTFNARIASEFSPATDNAFDLGRTGHEWRDLFIDGTANIDSLIADTADINGGTIDGTTIGSTTPSTGNFTVLTENASPVVVQTDIGTAPNEIPLNQYLGANAYIDTETPALDIGTGITTGTGTICVANGGLSGGVYKVTILIDLTGLNSGGTAGDIIGVNGTALPCYIARLPAMTVLGGRMTCLELPAGGDTDIDLFSAAEGTGVEDQAITALTETQIINGGTQALGTVTFFSAYPTLNQYLYLVGQSTSNATYTAGRFLIEIFGVQ